MRPLDDLKEAARDHPELLLPYLRDERQTLLVDEAPRPIRVPPKVWKLVDITLCEHHGIQSHESMAAASEYWEGFLSRGRK